MKEPFDVMSTIDPDYAESFERSSAGTKEALIPCPFCGSDDIDPAFVMYANDAECSPGCNNCGATAETAEKWNARSGAAQRPGKHEEFCHWLKGYLGAVKGHDELTPTEANTIRGNLNELLSSDGEPSNGKQPLMASRPAPPVPSDPQQWAEKLREGTEFAETPFTRCSAANGDALSIAETDREVMRQAIVEACDLLAERKYGNPARSPGHNARLVLERALSTGIPALPQEALRYAATKAVEAYRRAQSEGEVVIAMENLERALSPDEPRCSVTRPHHQGGEG
jgi:hypothetical protein